jgi:hypothetical protein
MDLSVISNGASKLRLISLATMLGDIVTIGGLAVEVVHIYGSSLLANHETSNSKSIITYNINSNIKCTILQ